jgi:nitrate reductase cytochrome c-type subunit
MNNIIYLITATPLSLIIVMVMIVAVSRYQPIPGNNRSRNYSASFFITFILLLSVTSTHLGAANVKESIKKESTSGKKSKTETEKSKESDDEQTNEERTKPNDPPKIDMPISSSE